MQPVLARGLADQVAHPHVELCLEPLPILALGVFRAPLQAVERVAVQAGDDILDPDVRHHPRTPKWWRWRRHILADFRPDLLTALAGLAYLGQRYTPTLLLMQHARGLGFGLVDK